MRRAEAHWDAKCKHWRILVQQNGQRKAFYSSNPSKAGKAEAEHKADVWLEDGARPTSAITFGELAEQYLAHIRTGNGTAHRKREDCTLRVYLLPRLKDKKVVSLTTIDFQEAIDACVEGREKPLSARTCGHVRSTIMALYKYARKADIPLREPFDLTIPTAATKGQRKILQTDDLKKLWASDSYYAPVFRFIVLTGLRPGEVCGLKKDDLTDNYLQIRRARNIDGETTTGKNKNALRGLILPLTAIQCIQPNETEWLFVNAHGQQLHERALYSAWQRLREHLCIQAVSLYELRHTMISHCKTTVPLPLLKQAVGHSASMDTLGTYAHPVDGDLQQTADLIAAAFADVTR